MPNTQTSVPAFTAGQVLTAQQQTQINTGIPVFATTTTRDAAFGGTGEKTLAEGQFAYIEASDTTQYYDGAAWQTVGATPGMRCVKAETAFSGVSSVTADSILTSSYTNYLVVINWQTVSGNNLYMRLRVGGVSTSTNYNSQDLIGTATTTSAQRFTGAAEWMIGQSSGAFNSTTILNIYQPQVATVTTMTANIVRNNGNYTTGLHAILTTGNQTDSTQFDGIQLLPSGSTITGNYAVYGYSKTV